MAKVPVRKLKKKDLIELSTLLEAQIRQVEEENRALRRQVDYPDLSMLSKGSLVECANRLVRKFEEVQNRLTSKDDAGPAGSAAC